jgi:hypothetical protein
MKGSVAMLILSWTELVFLGGRHPYLVFITELFLICFIVLCTLARCCLHFVVLGQHFVFILSLCCIPLLDFVFVRSLFGFACLDYSQAYAFSLGAPTGVCASQELITMGE